MLIILRFQLYTSEEKQYLALCFWLQNQLD